MNNAKLIQTPVHLDNRGYFAESWNNAWDLGIDLQVRQTNVCWTEQQYTLRGLHAQFGTAQVAKLVRVIRGAILDVFVDARADSPDFGRWDAVVLDRLDQAMYVPAGYYHGYVTLTDDVLVTYHQDASFDGKQECGLNFASNTDIWLQHQLNAAAFKVSDKDRLQPMWADCYKF